MSHKTVHIINRSSEHYKLVFSLIDALIKKNGELSECEAYWPLLDTELYVVENKSSWSIYVLDGKNANT